MITHRFPLLLLSILIIHGLKVNNASGQTPIWDDSSRMDWPAEFVEVDIQSSADGAIQKAYFRAAEQKSKRPLIVSLHTWSANFRQTDPLIDQVLALDFNYIRPDFRGPNNTREAMGSPLVVSDIDDAITFAIEHSHADPENIHVLGVSGGGYASLLAYMQSSHHIRSFSAWVPISDIPKWYEESIGRNAVYTKHIALATTGRDASMDVYEAIKRSPLHMKTPVERRADSKLYIYAGIHDGYTGSVPITHSLEMYNKVVGDFNPNAVDGLIPDDIIHRMVVSRFLPGNQPSLLGGRKIHYMNRFENKVQVVVFEGSHEMLTEVALDHVPSKTILTIGDSNGKIPGGWVDALAEYRFNDVLFNTCISGNTIGYDNLGRPALNTLKNITEYLGRYDPNKSRIGQILIMLGTNDCKKEFAYSIDQVPILYSQLLDSIDVFYSGSHKPEIVMISPPPIKDDHYLAEKYVGAAERVRYLNVEFKKLAAMRGLRYIDIQSALWPVVGEISHDGIHFTAEGYELMGTLIESNLFYLNDR